MLSLPRSRPTREGLVVGGLTLTLTLVAMASGNNRLYLLVAGLWSLWGLAAVVGAWNLRGLQAFRVLPPDLFAGVEAGGEVGVRCDRRVLPAVGIVVEDDDQPAFIPWVPCGGEGRGRRVWCFPQRGVARPGDLVLRSSFPFGLFEHARRVQRADEVVVYPRPADVRAQVWDGLEAGEDAARGLKGRLGEFSGLRPYRPGDRPSAVHWPSTARAGEILVMQGSGEVEPRIEVVVRSGGDWETALERAAGEVVDGFARGFPVGLVLPGASDEPVRFPPGRGRTWRRTLLEALARAPEGR